MSFHRACCCDRWWLRLYRCPVSSLWPSAGAEHYVVRASQPTLPGEFAVYGGFNWLVSVEQKATPPAWVSSATQIDWSDITWTDSLPPTSVTLIFAGMTACCHPIIDGSTPTGEWRHPAAVPNGVFGQLFGIGANRCSANIAASVPADIANNLLRCAVGCVTVIGNDGEDQWNTSCEIVLDDQLAWRARGIVMTSRGTSVPAPGIGLMPVFWYEGSLADGESGANQGGCDVRPADWFGVGFFQNNYDAGVRGLFTGGSVTVAMGFA
jgi:hypothetical protein